MISTAIRSQLAPQGTLRMGINFGNGLLANRDGEGNPCGIAPDLARELASRAALPMEWVFYESAGRMAEGAKRGEWDVAFLAVDPERASDIEFSAPYLEVGTTYLVPEESAIRTVDDVDRDGIRIALPEKSAYDLFLSRTLTRAQLVRSPTPQASVESFFANHLDALAGLRPLLLDIAERHAGTRVLDGWFTLVRQSVGIPKGRSDAARFIRDFVEDVKQSGVVRQIMESNGVRGASVALS